MAISSQEEAVGKLIEGYSQEYPDEVTQTLEGRFSAPEILPVLESLTPTQRAEIFGRFSPQAAADILEWMPPANGAVLLASLDLPRAAALMARLDEQTASPLLAELGTRQRREIAELMSFPHDSAGRLMDPRAITFREAVTVREATEQIRKSIPERATNTLFVVDERGVLAGRVALQDLLLAQPETRLQELVTDRPVSVQALQSRDEVVEILSRVPLVSLPVVDFQGRLLGVIRHEVLVRAAEQEASADIQSMFGASRDETALSKVSFAVRKRLPWLEINLATAFLAAAVVGLFEGIIAQFTALAVLLPVVAGQSGNTGAQALAVTMRGLTLREITVREWPRLLFKELRVGTVNGLAVSAVTVAGVYIWSGSAGLCLVIGIAMVVSMAIAGVSGAAVPIVLRLFGQDPAQSSSILLTTITDVMGFFSFLGLASVLSGWL